MTLSDPLLKELKGHIVQLIRGSTPPYRDEDETVFLLCHCIESIFLKGLVRNDGFTPWRADTFSWFYQLVRKYHRVIPLAFKLAFEEVLNDPKTRTQVGKTRLLIRNCLKRRCLYVPVQFHVDNEDYDDENLRVNYNKNGSILGHEILSQIFLSLIQQVSHYEFSFDLNNSSFLDESWQIPELVKAEFVPCEKLGLTMGFPMGFAVIVDIIENSLAAELSDLIAVGDIMDEFNGTAVRNFYGSKIESWFRKNKSKPFKITFIKGTDCKGQLYLPAIKLYRLLGLDPEKITYSKSQVEASEMDAIDLELKRDEAMENSTAKRPNSLTIHKPMPAILLTEDEEIVSQNGNQNIQQTSYQNMLEGLIELNPSPEEQTNNAPQHHQASNSNIDMLIEIDLSPPLQVENENDMFENCDTSENFRKLSLEPTELLNSSTENGEKPTKNSVYQNRYEDDTNPCMV